MKERERMLCRNQFVLGPAFAEHLPLWQRVRAGDSLYLTAHPDLNCLRVSDGERSILLLGFILDPLEPLRSDGDILHGLLRVFSRCDDLVGHTFPFGGRWVIIADDGKDLRLFNDAAGLRQVFYTDPGRGRDFWCASQPRMLADILGLTMDGGAVEFIDSYEFRKNPEFRWPGNRTPYREVRHMLPNHSLDLGSRLCRRYWPDRPLKEMRLDEGIEHTSAFLRGLMKAASQRFELALSITAGLDSRLVLAASEEIRDSIAYMSVREASAPEDHADVTVPSLLFSQLGLRHDIVKSSLILDDGFVGVFKKSAAVPHYVYAPDAQAILNRYGLAKVAVTGSASEIARSSFRKDVRKPGGAPITPEDLVMLQKMGNHPFALEAFAEWLSDAGDTYNLDVLDLFEWEQGHGNWLAMCQLEFDIAWKDIFTPYNCRELLTTMLSVSDEHRRGPRYTLYEELIRTLWPEVLQVPINPHRQKGRHTSSGVRRWLSKHLPEPAKEAVRRIAAGT